MRCSFSGRAGTYCLSAPVTVRPTSQLRVSSLCRTRAVNLQQPGYPQRRQSGTSRLAFHSTSSSSANQELSNSEVPENQQGFRHAILHDFCMSVPYGSIVLAAGLVSLLFGSGRKGIMFALGGAFMLAGAFFSLLQWRQHRPSTMFTLASAGVTAVLAWGFWGLVEAGTAAMPNLVMFAGSLAMLVFLIYNIIAGGNPPKKTTAADDEELAAAAAAS